MNNLLTICEIKEHPEIYIKWMCYDILITIDNQVYNLSYMKLIGGSFCYYCNGKYRTKKWIKSNCINVLGYITE